MTLEEFFEWLADVSLRKAVRNWAKRNPKSLEMRTHVNFGGKRYLIHIQRNDYRDYAEVQNEVSEMRNCGKV